jgi:hypothetical protein
MEIIIQPIEKDIGNNILKLLYDSISIEFNDIHVTIAPILKVDVHILLIDKEINLDPLT